MMQPGPATATRRIWSIGHGARPVEELIETLGAAGVRRLVDVRTAPGSRRHPQFGQAALAERLAQAGIAYAWAKDLGGFRKPRQDSRHVAMRSDPFRGYADHMETEAFERALTALAATAADTPTAFLCAEMLWWNCHRRMIADALTVRGWEVVHLLTPGRAEPHRLHPAARVEGARLIYADPGGREQGRLEL